MTFARIITQGSEPFFSQIRIRREIAGFGKKRALTPVEAKNDCHHKNSGRAGQNAACGSPRRRCTRHDRGARPARGNTDQLNDICHKFIVDVQDAIPAPLNYRGFPKSICTSVNHVVCHGIPGDRKLKAGDAVNIDITVIKDGFHGDTSRMFFVGKPGVQAQRLADIAFEGMWLGIEELAAGKRLGDVGAAVQKHVEKNRFSIVKEYCGHGIGRVFHEDPQVLHYGTAGTGLELKNGMTLTVEPMVNAGKASVKLLPDGWTVVTKDHSLSAQWEHTVLITDTGYEVLTLGANDR